MFLPFPTELMRITILSLLTLSYTFARQQSVNDIDQNMKQDSTSSLYTLKPGDVVELLIDINKTNDQEYRFSAGDLIEIRFIFLPDLNLEQRIRPDGKVGIPYIGDIYASNTTAKELRYSIQTLLSDELNDPEVLVVLKESGGQLSELKATFSGVSGRGKTFKIRQDGVLDLPFAGELLVSGLTVNEAQAEIVNQYVLNGFNVNIDIVLKNAEGSRFAIIGAVETPGYYIIENPITIFEAIALSGGFRNDATNTFYLIRSVNNELRAEKISFRSIISNSRKGIVSISANDVIYVPRTGLSKAADIVTSISQLLLFRGASIDLGNLFIK